MNLRPIKKSIALQRRADDVIAGGALTNSKRPQSFVRGVYPTHLHSGLGAYVKDVDGNGYIDYICSLGAVLFGYKNPKIEQAVIEQITKRGPIFSLGTELEVEVAEGYRDRFSYLQQVRFLKTSSEACAAALRIARAYSGKKYVLSQGYNGWHDEFTFLTPPAHGVPDVFSKSIGKLPIDYSPSLLENEVAAVILEPVITDNSPERIAWLHRLRADTKKHNVLLIFDETITGLRYPGLSVAKCSSIDPDLMVMGKSIAGGYPLSMLGGRRDVMSSDYFVSSTFAGDCVALSAAKAILDLIKEPGLLDLLHAKAQLFCTHFNNIEPNLIRIDGYGTRGLLVGSDLNKALFMQECVKAGLLFGPSFFYGTTHQDYDDHAYSICKAVLTRIKNNEVSLEGDMPQKAYAQKARE